MVMRDRLRAWIDLGDGQAFDVVAASGEQADDPGEDAGLVVDQNGDGVLFDEIAVVHDDCVPEEGDGPPPRPARPGYCANGMGAAPGRCAAPF